VRCAVPQRGPDEPKLVGKNSVTVLPGTYLAEAMGAGAHDEGFFCNYEPNPTFMGRFESASMRINALGGGGELLGIELCDHPFFIATLFQPQLTSKRTGSPHPLITAYLRVIHKTSAGS
jgi:CTP synthase (UTP-ammonia lyase)